MSFGFGVGDIIAVVNLLERVTNEIRNYRDAPIHVQQLGSEMHLLHRALQRLLMIEPQDKEDTEWLEHIRAIAIHCQQPLLSFIEKMRLKESSFGLGNRRTTTALSTIGYRLHWSLITRKDMDELRKVIMAGIAAINMMLGMQQLSSLQKVMHQNHAATGGEMERFYTSSMKFYEESAALLSVPTDIANLKNTILAETSDRKAMTLTAVKQLDNISSASNALTQQNKSILKNTSEIQENIAKSILNIMAIARDVKRILSMLRHFSQEMFAKIAANGQLLMKIHATLKRLLRAVEAIPLHLTLGIVRLDDAIGESWALPYQACQTLASFKDILQAVVFGNNRPGARYVSVGKFLLRSARDGVLLTPSNWQSLVKQGFHISQAIVLNREESNDRKCPFPNCYGDIDLETTKCSTCGKQSTFQKIDADQFGLEAATRASMSPVTNELVSYAKSRPQKFGPIQVDEVDLGDNEIDLFRNVHYTEIRDAIASVDEAREILEDSPGDSSALRYLGAWSMSPSNYSRSITSAIIFLENAVEMEPGNVEGWYLLARAYMETNQLAKAYKAYKRAVHINVRCYIIWNSIGCLYFLVKQYRDSLDAFARAIRLFPYEPYNWRNIGVLYDRCSNQTEDAADAYGTALHFGLVDDVIQRRLEEIRSCIENSTAVPRSSLPMSEIDPCWEFDFSKRQPLNEDNPVHIAPLSLMENDDGSSSAEGQTDESDGD